MLRLGALPISLRSSGMCATPRSMAARAERLLTACPCTVTCPLVHLRRPVMTSASSGWPLPATPARPKISPARTWRETSRSAGSPLSLWADTLLTDRTTSPASWSSFSTRNSTLRPTMSRAKSAGVVSDGCNPEAVTCPFRSTVMRSAISMTSPSLWEIKTRDLPSSTMERRMLKRSSIS